MKFELKAINYWSLLRTSFLVNLILGFVLGIFFALFMGLIFSFVSKFGGLSGFSGMPEEMPAFGILLIIYPIFFAFMGAVFNTIIFLIAAFVYNMVAKFVGGMEFEFNQLQIVPAPIAAQPAPSYYAPSYNQAVPPPPPPPIQPLPPEITPPPDNQSAEGPK
jgi:hypothetical protein